MASGDVVAELHYLQKLDLYRHERPFQIFIPTEDGQRSTNLEFEEHSQKIIDLRPNLASFRLDEHGFEVRNVPTKLNIDSFQDENQVKSSYFSEIQEELKFIEGGYDRVFFFDWRIRSSDPAKEALDETIMNINSCASWLEPVNRVHVDQSPRSVLHRTQLQLGDDAAFLLSGRVRVINAWRPIRNPVYDRPLAVCDGTSMPMEDLVESDHVRRKFKGSTYYAYHGLGHKWYYLSEQKPDEVLFFKMFDSDSSVKASRCPHASFRHPHSPEGCPPRESVEVRALVFNYPTEHLDSMKSDVVSIGALLE